MAVFIVSYWREYDASYSRHTPFLSFLVEILRCRSCPPAIHNPFLLCIIFVDSIVFVIYVDLVLICKGGYTLGTPIMCLVHNKDQRPGDYKEMADVPRPSHADYTYQKKYGIRASSGGGRSSSRETIGRVRLKLLLQNENVECICINHTSL